MNDEQRGAWIIAAVVIVLGIAALLFYRVGAGRAPGGTVRQNAGSPTRTPTPSPMATLPATSAPEPTRAFSPASTDTPVPSAALCHATNTVAVGQLTQDYHDNIIDGDEKYTGKYWCVIGIADQINKDRGDRYHINVEEEGLDLDEVNCYLEDTYNAESASEGEPVKVYGWIAGFEDGLFSNRIDIHDCRVVEPPKIQQKTSIVD